ncbi:MAG: sigma factor-like helix-turn-helix DNA-binding protein [Planctomycetota bacterium]
MLRQIRTAAEPEEQLAVRTIELLLTRLRTPGSGDELRRLAPLVEARPPAEPGGELEAELSFQLRRTYAEVCVEQRYLRWRPVLAAHAVRRLGLCPAEADELVEDTLVDFLMRPAYASKPDREAARLLYTMANNRVRDRVRRDYGRIAESEDGEDTLDTHEGAPSPLAALLEAESARRGDRLWHDLCDALDRGRNRLRPTQREVLEMHLAADEPHAVVAARLGLSEGAYTLRIHRVAGRLHKLLGPRWRLDLAPLSSRSIHQSNARSARERADQRLVWLVARRARAELKRELARAVERRIEGLQDEPRRALHRWIHDADGRAPRGDLMHSARVGQRLVRESLVRERPELVRLCLSTFSERRRRSLSAKSRRAAAVLHWCFESLLPELQRTPRATRPQQGETRDE